MSPFSVLLEERLRLRKRATAKHNPLQSLLIADALRFREAILTSNGSLATWSPAFATGRIPKDTYVVRHEDDNSVDWTQSQNHPITPEVFDMLFQDALDLLSTKDRMTITDRVIGADARYALPVRTITDSALVGLFTYTMFRPVPADIGVSCFTDKGFTLLVLPRDCINVLKYHGVLREESGKTVDHGIFMDFERGAGIVFGTQYLGAIKKTLFTVMNHLLPSVGVLPLHSSAVEDWRGGVHLFLGLSGTGKTTLSTGPGLTMIGDDEHLWTDNGVANMEYGCYAKLIDLSPQKEREIYGAVFGPVKENDSHPIIENAMVYPDGSVDVTDRRLTENSRAAYPLSSLSSIVPSAKGGHPSTIIFLTADACGVLPPIVKLPMQQAMLWFLLGYTSKLAGTETGVTTPQSTFSRFFGGAFMPRASADYLHLFQQMVGKHHPDIYLINTGWTGGAYGIGKRIDIAVTRRLADAALWGQLKDVPYREDPLFHLLVPRECPGVDPKMLDPRSTWSDPKKFDEAAASLAGEFSTTFDKLCTGDLHDALAAKCPGK